MNCEHLQAQLDELLRARGGAAASAVSVAGEEHLLACEDCRALVAVLCDPAPDAPDLVPFARALALSERVLPRLSVLDPGPEFTQAVLQRTRTALLRRRALHWWRRQLERPQFATEFAYAFTLAIVLLMGTPISPGAAWPGKLLSFVTAAPESAASEWLSASVLPIANVPLRLVNAGGEVSAEFSAELGTRGQSVFVVLDQFGAHARTFAGRVWEREWDALRPLLQQMHCDMRFIWGAAKGAVVHETDELRC